MINVLILTEGGAKIGYGHMSRCLALAQSLREFKPEIDVKFIVWADARARSFLRSNDIDHVSIDWLKRPDKIWALIGEETMVIIDSYKAPGMYYKRLRRSKFKPYVAVIDDYNRIYYEADSIINVSVANMRDAGYQKRRNVRYLLGNEYIILRKDFHRDVRKGVNKAVKEVLLTFGGGDCYDLIVNITNLLAGQDFNLHIVSPDKNVHNFARSRGYNFYSGLNAREMCSLMSKIDLCISGGGQTINELAYLGVPTIGICSSKDQSRNVKRWRKTGFLEYAGRSWDKDISKELERSLETMRDAGNRKEKTKIGRETVDANGCLRIVKMLLFDFHKKRLTLRKARIKDAEDVYNLSNDPLVRKVSKVSRKLEWKHHLSWMENKLKDKDHVFYIAGDSKIFWGQVRFNIDLSMREALISISLHKDLRGLGLSSLIIDRAVKALFRMRKDIEIVRAIVRRKNLVSIKSFTKADFQFVKDLKADGGLAKLFIRIA